MPELATSETLQNLDRRHAEVLQALDSLCLDIEEVLKKISPPKEASFEPDLQQAA
ncbi:hypothetical protein [Bythopirellula polymerisocia]|uniref:Uncharacterized protein n=1 Tax=Bythopirellula polymerisocia TaxID=2528003 RepID=A0A5C6C6X7_9BACT|nr:hypothetical protein [Bythopirellula polymerisocia]TWU20390.1 hypothetical protein Pla144_49650 [Bythopirellula polymerisocia]